MRFLITPFCSDLAGAAEDLLARSLAFNATETADEWRAFVSDLYSAALADVYAALPVTADRAALVDAFATALYDRTMAAWPAVEPVPTEAERVTAGALGRVA